MTTRRALIVVVLLLSVSLQIANSQEERNQASDSVATAQQLVTVSDYCAFLNAAAVADLQGFYDEKMGDDRLEFRGWRLEEQNENKVGCGLIVRS